MNVCSLSGRLMRPAVVFSEGKILKFILVTTQRTPGQPEQLRTAYVPCVIFEPPKDVETALLSSSSTKASFEMAGKIVRNAFEGASGERRYSTEVVIDPSTVLAVKG